MFKLRSFTRIARSQRKLVSNFPQTTKPQITAHATHLWPSRRTKKKQKSVLIKHSHAVIGKSFDNWNYESQKYLRRKHFQHNLFICLHRTQTERWLRRDCTSSMQAVFRLRCRYELTYNFIFLSMPLASLAQRAYSSRSNWHQSKIAYERKSRWEKKTSRQLFFSRSR